MADQHYFYQGDTLAAVIGSKPARLMHNRPQVAQLTYGPTPSNKLLQVGNDNSVLGPNSTNKMLTFTPYGHNSAATGDLLTAFNGEYLDLMSMGYLLGRGKRLYSPQLGIFCGPDPLSPFRDGLINCYMYCGGDPVNHEDPTGLFPSPRSPWRNPLARQSRSRRSPPASPRKSTAGSGQNVDNQRSLAGLPERPNGGGNSSPSMHQGAAELNRSSDLPSARQEPQANSAPNTYKAPLAERINDWWINPGYRRRLLIKYASLPAVRIFVGVGVTVGVITGAVMLLRKIE